MALDPTSLWDRLPVIAAGVIGGILSVTMMPQLTFRRAVTAVIGGVACAAYLTPLLAEYMGVGSRNLENGIAFALGIGGMHIVAGIFRLATRFREDPAAVIKDLKK